MRGFVISVGDWTSLAPLAHSAAWRSTRGRRQHRLPARRPDHAGRLASRRHARARHLGPVALAARRLLPAACRSSAWRPRATRRAASSSSAAATCWVWGRMPLPDFRRELDRWCWSPASGSTVVALVHIRSAGSGRVDELILVNGELVTSRPWSRPRRLILGLVGSRPGADPASRSRRGCWPRLRRRRRGLPAPDGLGRPARGGRGALILLAPGVRAAVARARASSSRRARLAYAAGLLDPLVAKFDVAYHSRGTLWTVSSPGAT